MANDLMGMFGPSPEEIQQQRQMMLAQQAGNYANQSPFQRAAAGMFTAGGQLGQMGANALGMVDPQVQKAQQIQAAMGQGDADLTTSKGYFEKAKQFANIDPRIALQLTLKGKELEKQEQAAIMAANKDAREERRLEEVEKEKIRQQAENAKAALEQKAEAARLRSEDTRYSAEQRAEAMRERTQMMGQIAQLMAEVRRMGIEAKSSNANQLKPGEVVKLRQQMGKDRTAVAQTEADTDSLYNTIGSLVNNDAGLSGITGISGVIPNMPGSKSAEAQSDLETIKGKLMGLGRTLQSQSGGKLGNMAVQEWKIIQDIIQNLDPKAGKDKLKSNLQNAQAYLDGLSERMRSTYQDVYSPYSDQLETLSLPERKPRGPSGKSIGNMAPAGLPSQDAIAAEIARRRGGK